jgi:hypothetical protein
MNRLLSLSLTAVALAAFIGLAFAQEQQQQPQRGTSHDGKVVSVTGTKLVMSDLDGKNEHTMTVATDAKITCDAKECKLTDLKAGFKIRVFTKPDDKTMVTRVEALDKNKDFERSGTSPGSTIK